MVRGGTAVQCLCAAVALLLLDASNTLNMPPARHEPPSRCARECLDFLDKSTDPYSAVASAVHELEAKDFVRLDERNSWSGAVKPGGKYYFTRESNLGSSLVAFVVGCRFDDDPKDPGSHGGFKVIGAHTDTPNLRVKPRSKRTSSGCLQIDVETYGGGLWHTWFDRDLSVSGKVVVRGDDGALKQTLVDVERPILRIPTLAIHLQTADERAAFSFNKEDHLMPVLATEARKGLVGSREKEEGSPVENDNSDEAAVDSWQENHEPLLLQIIASKLNVRPQQIVDFDLSLYDTQKAAFCGATSEFITSARLDNIVGCFVTLRSLLAYSESASVGTDTDVSVIALFDHEEVGSSSTTGAGSTLITESVNRISLALDPASTLDCIGRRIRKSMVVSFDMAHVRVLSLLSL